MKEIEIVSKAAVLSATLFEGGKADAVLIIASATGVKQAYYQKFAKYVASNGTTVITFDYQGIGRSLKGPVKNLSVSAVDWGRHDLESVLQYAISNYPNSKKTFLGHSIGGQLIGLAASSLKLDKIILVAAQSGYWKLWKGFGKTKMWFNWYVLFPTLLKAFGYLKSKKLSGMENLPKNVANQWRNWGKNPDYILGDKSINEFFYDKVKTDLTAFSIGDDDFAPLDSVKWMTNQFQNAQKKSIHLKPQDFQVSSIGHFGVFKERFSNSIWPQILNELA